MASSTSPIRAAPPNSRGCRRPSNAVNAVAIRRPTRPRPMVVAPRPRVLGEDRDGPGGDEQPAPVGAPASEHAVLRQRDFGSCTPDELAQLRRLMSRMKVVTPQRPSRRRRRHARGDSIDLRASIRRARRTGGDPATLVRRRVTERRRRVVLLADVSGSMEAYSRAYLYLLHGAVRALRAETFVFSTRLTRLTRTLARARPGAGARHGDGRDRRLVGRDADRQRPEGVQRSLGTTRARSRCGRGDRVRRLGEWRHVGAGTSDGPALTSGPPDRVGQPAVATPGATNRSSEAWRPRSPTSTRS